MASKTPWVKDWYMLGAVTGLVGSLGIAATSLLLDKAGVPVVRYSNAAGAAVLGRRTKLGGLIQSGSTKPGEIAISYLAQAIAGAGFGAGLSYVIGKTPPGNTVAKSMIGSATIWALNMVAGNQMRLSYLQRRKPSQYATSLGLAVGYGALHGYILDKYGSQVVQQSHPVLVKEVTRRQPHPTDPAEAPQYGLPTAPHGQMESGFGGEAPVH